MACRTVLGLKNQGCEVGSPRDGRRDQTNPTRMTVKISTRRAHRVTCEILAFIYNGLRANVPDAKSSPERGVGSIPTARTTNEIPETARVDRPTKVAAIDATVSKP